MAFRRLRRLDSNVVVIILSGSVNSRAADRGSADLSVCCNGNAELTILCFAACSSAGLVRYSLFKRLLSCALEQRGQMRLVAAGVKSFTVLWSTSCFPAATGHVESVSPQQVQKSPIPKWLTCNTSVR